MRELNCCREIYFEYESSPRETSSNSSGKLCYPKPSRCIFRIRELLSFISRKRFSKKASVRKRKSGLRVTEPTLNIILLEDDLKLIE